MKAPNITQGLWVADDRGIFSDGVLVAKGAFIGANPAAEPIANARMMAAAPALAAALHEAYERYVCRCGYKGCLHCAYSRSAESALRSAGYTDEADA